MSWDWKGPCLHPAGCQSPFHSVSVLVFIFSWLITKYKFETYKENCWFLPRASLSHFEASLAFSPKPCEATPALNPSPASGPFQHAGGSRVPSLRVHYDYRQSCCFPPQSDGVKVDPSQPGQGQKQNAEPVSPSIFLDHVARRSPCIEVHSFCELTPWL